MKQKLFFLLCLLGGASASMMAQQTKAFSVEVKNEWSIE